MKCDVLWKFIHENWKMTSRLKLNAAHSVAQMNDAINLQRTCMWKMCCVTQAGRIDREQMVEKPTVCNVCTLAWDATFLGDLTKQRSHLLYANMSGIYIFCWKHCIHWKRWYPSNYIIFEIGLNALSSAKNPYQYKNGQILCHDIHMTIAVWQTKFSETNIT